MKNNNIGLVEHAEMAYRERWGYVWGTFGQVLSLAVFNQKKNQYPQGVGNYASFIKSNWLNKRSVDCIGLMKSYLWWNNGNVKYTPSQDINANMAYNMAKKKGGIATIPEIPGLCVWRRGHIGVYIGNGWVIEAQGTKYGVRKNRLRDRNFTHWMEHPHIQYSTSSTSTPSTPTVNTGLVKSGSRGSHVSTLQSNLNKLGLNAGASDGIAGSGTVAAMKRFQYRYRLSADGIFGESSFNKLDDVLKNLGKFRKSKSGKSEYMDIDDAQVIRTKPENIEIKVAGNTLHQANVSGVNGTFFDTSTAPVTSPDSCVFIAMNKGKAISNNAQFNGWKAPARATIIFQKNELMGFRQLRDINPIRNITEWALGGHMVKPYMDFKNEKMSGAINYKTAHTYLGYDKDNNIYLIVKPNHMIHEIVPLLNKLKITNAVVLDGGGSSQMRHSMGNFTSNRRVNTVVALKQE